MNYTHIIWDWNGTLLNDVEWCREIINIMLKKRKLETLNTIESYYKVFGFPVKEYYKRVGFDFDKEPFEVLAVEYIELYYGSNSTATLFPEVKDILKKLYEEGIHQIILSASEQENLKSQIKPFGIESYFDEILGISDIFAAGKIDIGQAYIDRVKPQKTLLIGDTIHDKEVADALGVDCMLIASGHQSREALMLSGAVIKRSLSEVIDVLV